MQHCYTCVEELCLVAGSSAEIFGVRQCGGDQRESPAAGEREEQVQEEMLTVLEHLGPTVVHT